MKKRPAFTISAASIISNTGTQRRRQREGHSLALTGDISSMNAYFALYDKVTSADVKRVAGAIFTPANRTVVTMKANKP